MGQGAKKTRKTVDGSQMRTALAYHFFGSPGKTKYSGTQAAAKFESLNKKGVNTKIAEIKAATKPDDVQAIKDLIAQQIGGNAGRFATAFTSDEEKTIVAVATRLDLLGFGFSPKEFRSWCQGIAASKGYNGVKCNRRWFHGFMQRARTTDAEFGVGKRSKIDIKRAQKHSPEVFDKFFDMVKALYKKLHDEGVLATEVPEDWQIFNMDELHSDPEKKHAKVVGNQKRARAFTVAAGDKFPFHVTMTLTTCANGQSIVPPQTIHVGKNMTKAILDNIPPDWAVHCSKNGSQDQIGFEKWCRHFIKHVRQKHPDKKVPLFLVLDGHSSRWTYSGLRLLIDANIFGICLPSHTSALSQPNDNGTNRKWHAFMMELMSQWRKLHTGMAMQKADANELNAKTWKLVTQEGKTIVSSYAITGIFPLDREAKNYSKENLTISEGVSGKSSLQVPDQALAKEMQQQFTVFKQISGDGGGSGSGSGSLVLHTEAAKLMTIDFAKSAKEIARLGEERKRKSAQGIPNTHFGSCITARDFVKNIEEYQAGKETKLQEKEERKVARDKKKLDKTVAAEVNRNSKSAAKGKAKSKGKQPAAKNNNGKQAAKSKKRKRGSYSDSDSDSSDKDSDDDDEHGSSAANTRSMRPRTGGSRSASVDTFGFTVDSESESEVNDLDRTQCPPIPRGHHVVPVSMVRQMMENKQSWACDVADSAEVLMFQFDVAAQVDGGAGAARKEWFKGTDLREGDDEEEDCLCVSYDDGEDVCHDELPVIGKYGVNGTWYLLAEDE